LHAAAPQNDSSSGEGGDADKGTVLQAFAKISPKQFADLSPEEQSKLGPLSKELQKQVILNFVFLTEVSFQRKAYDYGKLVHGYKSLPAFSVFWEKAGQLLYR